MTQELYNFIYNKSYLKTLSKKRLIFFQLYTLILSIIKIIKLNEKYKNTKIIVTILSIIIKFFSFNYDFI